MLIGHLEPGVRDGSAVIDDGVPLGVVVWIRAAQDPGGAVDPRCWVAAGVDQPDLLGVVVFA